MSDGVDNLVDRLGGLEGNASLASALKKYTDYLSPQKKRIASTLIPFAVYPILSVIDSHMEKMPSAAGFLTKQLTSYARTNVAYMVERLNDDASYSKENVSHSVQLSAYKDIVAKADTVINDEMCPIKNLVILLYGPPGTGKSYLASLMAKQIDTPNRRLNLENSDGEVYRSEGLIEKLTNWPNGIWLVDEIDKEIEENPEKVRILHAVLDEIKTKDVSCILIMTTNNIDKLRDTPLCRPGRVDIIQEITGLTDEDIASLCAAYGRTTEEVLCKMELPYTTAKIVQECRNIALLELIGDQNVIR
jgi:SpoVK/Ycf46/Vps4 family AAA+-type ATPase